jgi:hypothetical protein
MSARSRSTGISVAAKAAWAAASDEPWSPAESAKSAAWCAAELARAGESAEVAQSAAVETEAAAMASEAERLLAALAALPAPQGRDDAAQPLRG